MSSTQGSNQKRGQGTQSHHLRDNVLGAASPPNRITHESRRKASKPDFGSDLFTCRAIIDAHGGKVDALINSVEAYIASMKYNRENLNPRCIYSSIELNLIVGTSI